MHMKEESMTEQTESTAPATSGSEAKKSIALMGRGGVFGVKAGMTQVYDNDGNLIAVTVIDLRPNVITQVKTKAKEGYNAVQIGILDKKAKSSSKSEVGHFKKSGSVPAYYYVKEFRLPADAKMDGLTVGSELEAGFMKEGDLVDLTAISKGKGFQGGMKRFHMAGGHKSHGASVSHRSLGSIGNRADPAKCFKNKKMPGQMGNEQITVQNVKVVKVDNANGVMLVNGSIPGPRSGIVTVRRAVKSAKKA